MGVLTYHELRPSNRDTKHLKFGKNCTLVGFGQRRTFHGRHRGDVSAILGGQGRERLRHIATCRHFNAA